MRAEFSEFYRPTKAEFTRLWNEAIIVLDTNVLLDLYRYSEETRESALTTLDGLASRLWLPHHVALEFQRLRVGVIQEQRELHKRVAETMRALAQELSKNHPEYRFQPLVEKLRRELDALVEYVQEKASGEFPVLSIADPMNDPIRGKLGKLFHGRVGAPYSDDQLEDLYKSGRSRYDAKRPPGFHDEKKPEPERYGDVVIWEQMLDHAQQQHKPVIFASGDSKTDWWWREGADTLGPRPELVREFGSRTNERFYMYPTNRFLDEAGKYVKRQLSRKTLDEVKAVESAHSPYYGMGLSHLAAALPDAGVFASLTQEALAQVNAKDSIKRIYDALQAAKEFQNTLSTLSDFERLAAQQFAGLDVIPRRPRQEAEQVPADENQTSELPEGRDEPPSDLPEPSPDGTDPR